ncbi:MAG TPA: hypothetical protein VFG30_12650 [Polyangiales bacterium]|nr:hypothetical protein [Polyangiales bacterium]
MPKAKTKRSPAKASPKRSVARAGSERASAQRSPSRVGKSKSSATKAGKSKSSARKAGAIDPRVLAAIGLALEDERVASERAETLGQPLSAWVASGRTRAIKAR